MSRSRRPRRALGAAAALTFAATVAACSTAPYRGATEVPVEVAGAVETPTTASPTSAPPTTAAPTTTVAPSTTAAPTTTAVRPTTTVAPTTTAGRSSVPGTDVSFAVPAGWRVAPTGVDLAGRALGPLAPAGTVAGSRVVLVRADAPDAVPPAIVLAVTPRPAGTTALSALTAARAALGTAATSAPPVAEPRVLSGGAWVTYRATITVGGAPTEVLAEHDVFEIGDALLWVLTTTTPERADLDGLATGRLLQSLRTP